MAEARAHEARPMPHEQAGHLLNPLRRFMLSPKGLVQRLDLEPDSRVLELGPGPGYFSPEVARSIPNGTLVLVDVQQEMLDMARGRLESKGVTNVDFLRGDAVALPLGDASFDVAFLVAVLGEVPDREACLREIYRVLRPNGLLSITELKLADPDSIPLADMLRLLETAGFQRCERFGRLTHYTINCRKVT